MKNVFNSVKMDSPKHNKFDLSHEKKMSIPMGTLIPFFMSETLPGDRFRVTSEVLARMAPMLAPVMHRVKVRTEYFYVPYRLIFDEAEDFFTGGKDGTTTPTAPYIELNTSRCATGLFGKGHLSDYLGIPPIDGGTEVNNPIRVSAFPFRAYALIYNEYYRNQNLSPEVICSKASGLDVTTNISLLKSCWEQDLFTSALPWAQRGPDVLIPMEGEGGVTYKDNSEYKRADGDYVNAQRMIVQEDGFVGDTATLPPFTSFPGRIENVDKVTVENATVTYRDFRLGLAIQKFYEKMAVIGSRYIEYLRGIWGVKSSDARLQRPEFLGGGSASMSLSEVLSTFQADEGNPQGNMAGHGVSYGNQNGFSHRFEEHGIVMGFIRIIPNTTYQQGIQRFWRRRDRFDFYIPDLAHIGEQEIKVSEVWYDPAAASTEKDETFGYQSRYVEYKYIPSSVHGEFRDTLAFWHMGRIFENKPSLNTEFVQADPTERIFAVPSESGQQVYLYINHNVSALRPIPYFSTPRLVG